MVTTLEMGSAWLRHTEEERGKIHYLVNRPKNLSMKKLPLTMVLEKFFHRTNVEVKETDFQDGTKLVALVETLQKRKLKHNKKPINQHHEIENITIALDAIQEDGLKLVNIGKTIHIIDDIMIQILVHSVVSMTKIVWRGVRSIILSIFGNSSLF